MRPGRCADSRWEKQSSIRGLQGGRSVGLSSSRRATPRLKRAALMFSHPRLEASLPAPGTHSAQHSSVSPPEASGPPEVRTRPSHPLHRPQYRRGLSYWLYLRSVPQRLEAESGPCWASPPPQAGCPGTQG